MVDTQLRVNWADANIERTAILREIKGPMGTLKLYKKFVSFAHSVS